MKAAVLEAKNCLVVKDVAKPEIVRPNDILLKIKMASLCGSDLGMIKGRVDVVKIGTILGHEFAGTVVGYNVFGGHDISLRENTAVNPYFACGNCDSCLKGATNHCKNLKIIGGHINGGFAEYCLAPASNLYRIGDIDFGLAAFIQPLACSFAGFEKISNSFCVSLKGKKALILGGGPMGILLAKMCEDKGIEVIISEPCLGRREFIEKLGWAFIDPTGGGEIPPASADIVIDAVGSLMEKSFEYVRDEGEVLLFGLDSRVKEQYRLTLSEASLPIYYKHKRIHLKGSFLACGRHFNESIRLMKSKSWADFLRLMITVALPLEKINEGFRMMESGEAIKILINPN